MAKYKRGLVEDVKNELADKNRQEILHQKYSVDENMVVVEKSNMVKFFIRSLGIGIHVLATIILLVLAAIGLLALLYPDTRNGLYQIYQQIIDQLKSFL